MKMMCLLTRTWELLSSWHSINVTPVNTELVPRQLSQEQFGRRRSGAGSDWTNLRKDRKVGSPGNTATADYFIEQQTPLVQVVDIDLEEPGKDKAMTKF